MPIPYEEVEPVEEGDKIFENSYLNLWPVAVKVLHRDSMSIRVARFGVAFSRQSDDVDVVQPNSVKRKLLRNGTKSVGQKIYGEWDWRT
jgi:hypothetical protein